MMRHWPVRVRHASDTSLPHTWRPWPLRWPFFTGFIFLCLIIIIGIDLVLRGCAAEGCHVFGGPLHTDVSIQTYFTYAQLPTVLSLILNLLWAVAHHDVMRLEPYFRMSAPGGTTAADSIFLEYPYTFPLFVPFKAIKHRHSVVFISSSIALTMSFLVTPLVAGIFDDSMLPHLVEDSGTVGALRTFNENSTLSGAFTYAAYHTDWLAGAFPRFTTPEYTLLPVGNRTWIKGTETWTAETMLFEAQLVCESAGSIDIKSTAADGITLKIVSNDGAYNITLCDQKRKNLALLQYIATVNADYAENRRLGINWRNPFPPQSCDGFTTFITPWTAIAQRVITAPDSGGNASEVYLYGWASGVNPPWPAVDSAPRPTNITALFCKTNYYSQEVRVSFLMPDGIVEKVDRLHTRKEFTNLRNFDQIINGEMRALATPTHAKNEAGDLFGLGYQPAQVPNADSQLQRRLGVRPKNVTKLFVTVDEGLIDASSHSSVYIDNVNGLPGIALSGRTLGNLHELLDREKLAAAYERALQTMFALAMSVEMVQLNASSAALLPVIRSLETKGFVVNNTWARGSQGALGAVVMAVMGLAVLIGRRRCMLDGEPNSLVEGLRLLAASPDVSVEIENAEFHDSEELLKVFNEGGGHYTLDILPHKGPRLKVSNVQEHAGLPGCAIGERRPWMEKLWVLKGSTGLGFLVVSGVVGLLLALAFGYSRSQGGLPTFAPVNSFWYKVIFTHIPLAVGMAAEPTAMTIAYYQCMLAPCMALTPGPASSAKSLAVDYDKSPPHFQLIRALNTRNLPLAALTVSIFLCNALAVSLAGLFSDTTRKLKMTTEVYIYETPKVQGMFTTPAQEMYFLLSEQLSGLTGPLTWTTPNYYVLPVLPANPEDVQEYETNSLGLGIDVKCNQLEPHKITMACDMHECASGTHVFDYTDYSLVVVDPCWGLTVASVATAIEEFTTNYTWGGLSHDNIIQSTNCPNTFFPIWVERAWDPQQASGARYETHLDSLVLKCTTLETFAQLNIIVSRDQVVSSTVVRNLTSEEVTTLYSTNRTGLTHVPSLLNHTIHGNTSGPVKITDRLPSTFIDAIRAGIRTENSPDSHKIRWFNYLMKTIDPRIDRNLQNMTHIPDGGYISAAMEEVYRRLFAINLRLYEAAIINPGVAHTHTAEAVVLINRVAVSAVMFGIAESIILIIMVVLTYIYLHRRQPVGHVPKNLAGMYALLYASNAKEECGQLYGKDPKERAKQLEEFGGEYAYGSFQGGEHYGIYRQGKVAGS